MSQSRPLNLLIVDSNEVNVQRIVANVESGQISCCVAALGEQALEILQRQSVDVVFVELQLASESGIGLLAQLLSQPTPPSCVAMASRMSAEEMAQLWRMGVCDVVFKPATRQALLSALERAARQRQLPAAPLSLVPVNVPAVDDNERLLHLSIPLVGDYDAVQKHIVHQAIRRFDGNRTAAARALGIHRRTLYRFLER